jgi:hypothetical protein
VVVVDALVYDHRGDQQHQQHDEEDDPLHRGELRGAVGHPLIIANWSRRFMADSGELLAEPGASRRARSAGIIDV